MIRFVRRAVSATLVLVVLCSALVQATCADPPMHTIKVTLRGNEPVAARLRIVASDGQDYAPEATAVRKTLSGESYFYADRAFAVSLPAGNAGMMIAGGLEHLTQTISLDIVGDAELTVDQKPWIDMAARGWYSGDSHVHLHTGN